MATKRLRTTYVTYSTVDAESVQRELELLTGLIQSTPPRTPPLDFLMRDHKEAGACRHVSSQSSIVLAPKSMSTVNVGSRQMRAVTTSVPQTSVAINGTASKYIKCNLYSHAPVISCFYM